MQVKVKPWVFWVVLLSPILAAVLTILYLREENERGEKEWARCQENLQSKGQSINWNEYVPPPIPADQNFFAAPKMQVWFVKNPASTNNELALALANSKREAIITNSAEAAAYIAWAGQFEPQLKLIRQALKRPQQRMDGAYSDPFDAPQPDISAFGAISEVLWQRARCQLIKEHSDLAFTDLVFLFDLSRVLRPPPGVKGGNFVAALSENAIILMYASIISQGLDSHAWNSEELTVLDSQLEQIDLLSSLAATMAYERTSSCYMAENTWTSLGKHRLAHPVMLYGSLCENLTLITKWDEEEIESIDLKARQIHPREINTVEAEKTAIKHTNSSNVIALNTTRLHSETFKSLAFTQVMVDQTRIACALERYRLAHGKYPLLINSLVPQYLDHIPNDIISGKSMIYQRQDEQNFLLYSVGWDEIDDGGIIARKPDGKEDHDHGDWVWDR